ncbi:MAG TPA: threonine--tRNA ligase [Euzebyales bacterium]|nr:threonine--tRNA ligase [Euzebyales bacterium]
MHAPPDHADTVGDHRQLGRRLGLFASHELAGAGLPLWLAAGAAVREELERFVVELERAAGYQRVYSPVLGKRELYERSGHWQHFRDDMFPPMDVGDEQLVLRPSNCPHHILIYAATHHSFRDLPVRISELGAMFRMERSGVLGGLSRVRAMTLNDAHVFVEAGGVAAEVTTILALIRRAYAVLGISQYRLRLSLRGPGGNYADRPGMWDRAERGLRDALARSDMAWDEAADEAAFYGPKIDVQITDARGREETLSTVQVDLHLPQVFDLGFQAASGGVERPVIIHRSLISTMERLVAHLTERYAGAFPVWLAPVQLAVMPVGDGHLPVADRLADVARARGLRIDVHPPAASLSARIRRAQEQKVPFMAVIGDREVADGTVSLRRRDGVRPPVMAPDAVVDRLARLVTDRRLDLDL